jgi:excisionase family DNA binding protein
VEKLLTVKDAGEYLRLDPKTIYRMIIGGKIKAAKMGKDYRFKAEWLDEALDRAVPQK